MGYSVYVVSILILVGCILSFFGLARGRHAPFGRAQSLLQVLVALPLLISAVAMHFLKTNECTAMIPPVFPSPVTLVLLTGVFEILGAIGLFVPRARRSAALWIAILMVAVFPANIWVADQTFGGLHMPGVPVRLVMQMVYIWMVLLAGYGLPGRNRVAGHQSLQM